MKVVLTNWSPSRGSAKSYDLKKLKWPQGVTGVMSESRGKVVGAGEAVQADHEVAQGGHDLWGGTGSDAGQVLTEGWFLCSNEAYQFMHVTALVELRGIEPLTYSMRTSRATNCATAPVPRLGTRKP